MLHAGPRRVRDALIQALSGEASRHMEVWCYYVSAIAVHGIQYISHGVRNEITRPRVGSEQGGGHRERGGNHTQYTHTRKNTRTQHGTVPHWELSVIYAQHKAPLLPIVDVSRSVGATDRYFAI